MYESYILNNGWLLTTTEINIQLHKKEKKMEKAEKINLHKQVAGRLKKAVESHEKAIQYLENDKFKEAGHQGIIAYGHVLHAKELIQSVAKDLADKQ